MSDQNIRETLQNLVGLYEILSDGMGQQQRSDLEKFVKTEEDLIRIRLARLEEKINSLRLIIGALGAAVATLAGTIAILAD